MRLSELMRSSASADPDELRERVIDLAHYLEDHGDALIASCGVPLAAELKLFVPRLSSLNQVLELVTEGSPVKEN